MDSVCQCVCTRASPVRARARARRSDPWSDIRFTLVQLVREYTTWRLRSCRTLTLRLLAGGSLAQEPMDAASLARLAVQSAQYDGVRSSCTGRCVTPLDPICVLTNPSAFRPFTSDTDTSTGPGVPAVHAEQEVTYIVQPKDTLFTIAQVQTSNFRPRHLHSIAFSAAKAQPHCEVARSHRVDARMHVVVHVFSVPFPQRQGTS